MLPQIQIIPSNLNLEQTNTKRLCFLMTQYQLIYELRKKLLTELLV